MGTKERLAEQLQRLARIIPGIGSYQDKEGLREGDKRLRDTLAHRLDSARKAVEQAVYALQRDGHLDHLDRMGRLQTKLHHAADTVRFASRGYSGAFNAVKIGEKELERLYDFDISVAESVSAIQETAQGLTGISARAIADDALKPLEDQLASFENTMQRREALLRQE